TPRYAALYAVVHRKKRRGGERVREELVWTVLRCPGTPAPDDWRTTRSDWGSPELALTAYYADDQHP
ncbi:MAG: hypothetical protein M3P49_07245, partial [Actinomycetota bacterium]|nr:hypothetical protein [Actinomycetota bacterium]